LGGSIASKALMRVGPLYHGKLADLSIMLSPCHPDKGMKGIFSTLYPTFLR